MSAPGVPSFYHRVGKVPRGTASPARRICAIGGTSWQPHRTTGLKHPTSAQRLRQRVARLPMARYPLAALIAAFMLLPGIARAAPAAPVYGQCNATAIYDASTNGATQLVALVAKQSIYVCGFAVMVGGTATSVSFVYGTGTNCGTGQVALTPAFQIGVNGGIVDDLMAWNGLTVPAGNALCIKTGAGNAVQALVKYLQQ